MKDISYYLSYHVHMTCIRYVDIFFLKIVRYDTLYMYIEIVQYIILKNMINILLLCESKLKSYVLKLLSS